VRGLVLPCHEGKAAALNAGIREAHGEIIVFTDARQTLEPDSVRHLVANFADQQVGCVSGELMLTPSSAAADIGLGAYWQFEKKVRIWESCTGSVVGGTGALYAVRRDLVQPLPAGTLLDDVYIPLQVARLGRRVVFDSEARAWDTVTGTTRAEFWRKVRTLTGNYQLLQIAPWVLSASNPLLFRFISHKLLRLVAPFLLLVLLMCSFSLTGSLYRVAAAAQIVGYSVALLAPAPRRLGVLGRLGGMSLTFIVLNSAAIVAFVNFVLGKRPAWSR
jgi:cellulose synthase/poly-beta-1,6-N-acetylglucosamine synthase-like glycosyltransferase